MAEQVIKPDLNFINEVINGGGESMKKCFQCATCTVVCNVTPDDNPFPRKEMVWAQWGLKEKFIGNPDVWLCHQCNDCTAYCPRGAKPGEVLGAIRKQSIKQYSAPAALVNFVNSKVYIPIMFLLLAGLLSVAGTFGIHDGEIIFTKFASTKFLQIVFTPVLLFGIAVGVLGVRKFWADMKAATGVRSGDLKGSVMETAKEILSHKKFTMCDVNADRFIAHFLVFYSFIALGIATALGVLYIDILHMESPFRLGYGTPVKLFGFIGAAGLFTGALLMINNRFKHSAKLGLGSYFDWLLITIVTVIMASGILAWITRLAGVAPVAYSIYFIHLVFVLSLFLYLPFSKLGHLFYRSAAICFMKYSGRERK
ncbi:MAG: quinone-interacting membrane-bound oxidoreductase complex subunit QmoC [Nitrospirae bacterium]|nr:quinone-interacting membrane-bound oxidoreductase complex subunit QmoC [Nitrospirota bacterium]